jgi:hypothetical protein
MIELQPTERGNVRVMWQDFIYEMGPAIAKHNAAKLIEQGSLPGRGTVKCKIYMLSKGGAEYRVQWVGTKDQALAFATSLRIEAQIAEQQKLVMAREKAEADERKREALLARYAKDEGQP